MKKVNTTILSSGKVLSSYKKDSEYQSWIDKCVSSGVWGRPDEYTIDIIDATEEIEQKRQENESASKMYVNNHIQSTDNPHSVTKQQIGLENVDNISAANLRDRSTHTGTQLSSTITDFNEAAQDAVGNALVSNLDVTFNYPDADNKISAQLTPTGIVAGTYSLVTVDSKGRVVDGTNIWPYSRYTYCTTTTTSRAGNTFIDVNGLTTDSLPAGLYTFRFFGRLQSGSPTNGTGLRLNVETASVSTCNINWIVDQNNSGTQQSYQYSQLDLETDVTSASAPSANTTFNVQARGVVRITSSGSLKLQIRSENQNTASSILEDSVMILELV